MKDKYRFDDAYGKVYKYEQESNCYAFFGSYAAYGITAKMSDQKKTKIVESTQRDREDY